MQSPPTPVSCRQTPGTFNLGGGVPTFCPGIDEEPTLATDARNPQLALGDGSDA